MIDTGHILEAVLGPHLARHGLTLKVSGGVPRVYPFRFPRPRRPDLPEALPVAPNRPSDLSGGAAAELNFDE